ncbi:hypothetical protein, partial [Mycolicibacterium fallax]|uniref:hypothetical protein n=1 Tax=Mycolicibacterium fallax TaxID=1793 RepID=UPI0021F33944
GCLVIAGLCLVAVRTSGPGAAAGRRPEPVGAAADPSRSARPQPADRPRPVGRSRRSGLRRPPGA